MQRQEQEPGRRAPSRPHSRRDPRRGACRSHLSGTTKRGSRGPGGGPTSGLYERLRSQPRRALTTRRDPSGPRAATRPERAGARVQLPQPLRIPPRHGRRRLRAVQTLRDLSGRRGCGPAPSPSGTPPPGPKDHRVRKGCRELSQEGAKEDLTASRSRLASWLLSQNKNTTTKTRRHCYLLFS